jgi:serine/threonine-protein phosphatase 6 regulatory subunit 3
MFWRFGFHNTSAIESIIEKEGSKIEDILNEEDLIQEIKGQNQKVIELYVSRTLTQP